MDKALGNNCNASEYLKCVTIGLLCVQEDPNDRPTMPNVLFMLGSETATLPTPKQPAFVVRRCPSSKAPSSTKHDSWSHNNLTVTLEDGRQLKEKFTNFTTTAHHFCLRYSTVNVWFDDVGLVQ